MSANVRLRAVSETHETTAGKLEWMQELREQARHAGSEKSVARHREEGKLLARERAEKLWDFLRRVLKIRIHYQNPLAMRKGDAMKNGAAQAVGRMFPDDQLKRIF